MFETIGRHRDDEANKRRFASLLICSLALGAGAAFTLAWTTVHVIETFEQPVDTGPIAWLDAPEEEIPVEAPPPPPPPLRAKQEVQTPNEPDEPDLEKQVLEPITPKPIADLEDAGSADGDEEGHEQGEKDGQKDGVPVIGKVGGTSGSWGQGSRRIVHRSEVRAKRRPTPLFPQQAHGMGDQRCEANVDIDRTGVPVRVTMAGCPSIFAEEARRTLLKWRWYPYRVDGQKMAVSTKIAVVFKD